MPFGYDTLDITSLRVHTLELCRKLEELQQQLQSGSLTLADVQNDFNGIYQPDALALVDAITVHLRDDDPRIYVEYRDNTMRIVRLWDRPTIAEPLRAYDAHVAGVQLHTIASILRELAESPPEPVSA